MNGWRVAAVEHDGDAISAELIADDGERRHVELGAGLLAVLGRLSHRFDGLDRSPDTRLDEWGRPQ